jgi:hypothetical protein
MEPLTPEIDEVPPWLAMAFAQINSTSATMTIKRRTRQLLASLELNQAIIRMEGKHNLIVLWFYRERDNQRVAGLLVREITVQVQAYNGDQLTLSRVRSEPMPAIARDAITHALRSR